MAQTKKSKKLTTKKISFKSPVVLVIIVLLVTAGIFLAFSTFAADGSGAVGTSSVTTKDTYGCQTDYRKRPNLTPGSSGACVYKLQELINRIYPNANIAVDGKFGSVTKSYVIKIQNLYGITPDGIVGQETWRVIYCALHNCTN